VSIWPVLAASNIRGGDNPPFDLPDFLAVYPQFGGGAVPPDVLEMYLELANSALQEQRWHSYWKTAMGLFIAHFATLWTMSTADPTGDAAGVLAAGAARGLVASKTVGAVSMSMDYSLLTQDLNGWGAWKQTTFGSQLATLARLAGKGGMQVW
jgi:hypothetical protein